MGGLLIPYYVAAQRWKEKYPASALAPTLPARVPILKITEP